VIPQQDPNPFRPKGPKIVFFFIASIAHPGGEVTRRRITADDLAHARTLAWQIADDLDRPVTSVEVWKD
jgi:hypothetical protein